MFLSAASLTVQHFDKNTYKTWDFMEISVLYMYVEVVDWPKNVSQMRYCPKT